MQSLSEIVGDFIEYLGRSGKSSLTIVAYKNDLSQLVSFLATLGKTRAEDVTTADLEAFKQNLASKNYTAKSVARKLNAVKGVFRWAESSGKVRTDPALPVAHPKYELAAPRILSPIEYRALRDAAREDTRIAAIVELLLQTGMRISEVAALKIEDIKTKENRIVVSGREVPLSEATRRAVEAYLEKRPKLSSAHLFITKTGKPLLVRNIRAAIERCFAEAGIEKATVNDIRNTFIVYQLGRGVDLLTVSQTVGHKRLATTERYLKLIKDRKKDTKKSELSEL